ncbi:MAG: heparinase II/III family protein, partial [Armatimonadota bacterium]
VWSDSDGGWHEGTSYWRGYLNRVTWWLDIMRAAFGVDGYRRPFFHNVGDFALYVVPPGIEDGGFGDLCAGQTAGRLRPLMAVFARHAGNPHWQWYVEQAGDGEEIPGGYLGFLRATLRRPAAKAPADLPPSRHFAGTGIAVLHTDLLDRSRDVQFEFKSSRFGSHSHGYEAQNSFLLAAWGKPLLIRTGHRDGYGSPHHRNWMWETRSVNCILVNGRGQKTHSVAATGEITDFKTSDAFDYVVGEAAPAYEGRLNRFTRSVVFAKPGAIVIWDHLEAPEPATYQWLLHAPSEFAIAGAQATARNGPAAVKATWLAPAGLRVSQTGEFDPPPHDRKLDQWHLTAETQEAAPQMHFVTVLQPYRADDPAPPAPTLEQPEGAFAVSLSLARDKAVVLLNPTGETITYGDVQATGRLTAMRFDAAGKPTSLLAATAGQAGVGGEDAEQPRPKDEGKSKPEGSAKGEAEGKGQPEARPRREAERRPRGRPRPKPDAEGERRGREAPESPAEPPKK